MNLSSRERQVLESVARKYTSPFCNVIRARIILLADEGRSRDVIAPRLSARPLSDRQQVEQAIGLGPATKT
jgi:hypothetical protein